MRVGKIVSFIIKHVLLFSEFKGWLLDLDGPQQGKPIVCVATF